MFLVSDIIYFKEQCSLAKYPTLVVPNDFDINVITLGEFYLNYTCKKKNYDSFKWFLDDINSSSNGLPLTRYDKPI